LPGGAQKAGETVEEALTREILEETGLQIKIDNFATMIDIIDRDDEGQARHHYTVADYVCSVTGGTLSPNGDADDAKWFSLSDLDTLDLTPNAKEVIEAAWKS
jgi:ADP-ribose pyrophosphatase YjhB (NUDIX family)